MDLILIYGAVQLRIEDHGRRADVILARIVVVALVVGVVIVGGYRDRGRRAGRPGAVVVTRTAAAGAAAGEDVGIARPGRHQRQGRRRGAVSRVHRHAIRRVSVLLILRRQHCKRKVNVAPICRITWRAKKKKMPPLKPLRCRKFAKQG